LSGGQTALRKLNDVKAGDDGQWIMAGSPMPDDSVPTPGQIKSQLDRMLTSPVFTETIVQANLLEHLVINALEGKEVTEKTITVSLFPSHEGKGSSVVRANKNELRARIDEYYAQEGSPDLVLIALPALPRKKGYKPPPGQAYKPVFTYNPNHPADQDYRRGLYHLAQCGPADDGIALDYFTSTLAREPDHALAIVGKADVYLRCALYYHVHLTPQASLKLAAKEVGEVLSCDPQCWRAHAIQATLHLIHRRWKEAQKSFDTALACDGWRTRYSAWYYPAYLAAVGRCDEAIELAQERAREQPDDLPSQLALGVFLYMTRHYDEAVFALALAEAMNARQWIARAASALVCIALNEPAAAHIVLVHQLIGEDLFPGLLAFCLSHNLRLRETPDQWGPGLKNATDPLFSAVYAALDELLDRLPKPPRMLQQIVKMSKAGYVYPVQIALAHMAVGDTGKAVAYLKRACGDHYPLMAWLSVLPLFEPLREYASFRALTREIAPPFADNHSDV
jgi:tetratricopeptide (TPR) repeat protein